METEERQDKIAEAAGKIGGILDDYEMTPAEMEEVAEIIFDVAQKAKTPQEFVREVFQEVAVTLITAVAAAIAFIAALNLFT